MNEAQQIDAQLRQLAGNWAEITVNTKWQAGELVNRMTAIQGWKEIGFKSKGEWLLDRFGDKLSRSLVYESAKKLRENNDLDVQTLDAIPAANLVHLQKLPEKKRKDPAVLENAKLPERKFISILNSEYDLHIPCPKKVVFDYQDEGEADEVIKALDNFVASQEEPMTRAQALREILNEVGLI
jgi:hypothetical protein